MIRIWFHLNVCSAFFNPQPHETEFLKKVLHSKLLKAKKKKNYNLNWYFSKNVQNAKNVLYSSMGGRLG